MKRLLFLLLLGISLSQMVSAEFRVAKIFSSHMVLQRNVEIPVWGWADGKERISVAFDGKSYKAKLDSSGKWVAYLPKMNAGGPFEMRVRGNGNEVILNDVMIGDVWLCSGQSNMEWTVALSRNAEAEIADASDRWIRHFKVPTSHSYKPEIELAGGEWQTSSPETVGSFTAVGYFFARHLRKHQDVPIGLLNSSWGGSRIEPWMTAASLGYADQASATVEVENMQANRLAELRAALKQKLGTLPEEDEGLVNGAALWAKPDYSDKDWDQMNLPGQWEGRGLQGLDGIVWFRRDINLTADQAEQGITLSLGKIDDSDTTWVNGQKVGETTQAWNQNRIYKVPGDVLKAGANTITIRVEDTGGGGGIHGSPSDMFLRAGNGSYPLSGDWKFKIGQVDLDRVLQPNQVPTILYNKMIHPIVDFPIKGVLWYQGESNAGEEDALKYRELFATMIKDWRNQWKVGEFPFLWVQLANFMAPDAQPAESSWAVLRESQSATLAVPNTAEAVIIDIGEADDIHPTNKQDVGYRLSLAARKLAYGEDVVHSGPVYRSIKVDGSEVRIKFELFGSRLLAKDKYGYLKGFTIAGADKKFVWARARIVGNEVFVWSEDVKKPAYVRYAWGNNPEDANLYNIEGLPASPFRTDGVSRSKPDQ